jgi:predicted phosphodiesterase
MRLAFVSDIHGNLTAFEAVLADLRGQSPDAVYHLGDLAANGSRPAETVDRVRELGWSGVYGNVDEMLWAPHLLEELFRKYPERHILRQVLFDEMLPAALAALGPERVAWLQALPPLLTVGDITLLHASPGDTWKAPAASAADSEFEAAYGRLGTPLVIYAHIHHPHVRRLPGMTVVNTGSVSLPYDGDPRASYLLVTDGVPETRRVAYDIEAEIELLRESRTPRWEWLAALLRSGIYQPPF